MEVRRHQEAASELPAHNDTHSRAQHGRPGMHCSGLVCFLACRVHGRGDVWYFVGVVFAIDKPHPCTHPVQLN